MMRLPRRLALPLLLLAILPADAGASTYSRVLHTYQLNGAIPPCLYTGAQLATALKGVDVYGQQYFSDFTNAIQSALSQRAAGACEAGGPAAAATPTSSGPGLRLPPVTAATGARLPLPLLGLAILAALGMAATLVGGVRRALGLGAGGGGPWRHLWAEAGWRCGGAWADFQDWLHRGRRRSGFSRPAPRPRG